MKYTRFRNGLLIGMAACGLLIGCSSLPPVQNIATVANKLAHDVAVEALKQKPEWLDGFNQAVVDLQTIESHDQIDVSAVADVIARLPVKQLKSSTAQMLIADGAIVIELFTPNAGNLVQNAQTTADIKLVVAAIEQGLKRGIAEAQAAKAQANYQKRSRQIANALCKDLVMQQRQTGDADCDAEVMNL